MYTEEQLALMKRFTYYPKLVIAGFWVFVSSTALELFFQLFNAIFLNYKTDYDILRTNIFSTIILTFAGILIIVGYAGIFCSFKKQLFLEIYDNLDVDSITEKRLNRFEIFLCQIGNLIAFIGIFTSVLVAKALADEFEEEYDFKALNGKVLSVLLSIIAALCLTCLFAMHCVTGHEQRVLQFEKAQAMLESADKVFLKYNAEDSYTFGFDKDSLHFSLSEYWNYCKDDEYCISFNLDKDDFLVSTVNMDFDFDDSIDRAELYDDFVEEFHNATSAFKETELKFQYSEMGDGLTLPEDFKENFMNSEDGDFEYKYELSDDASVYIEIERDENYEGNKYIKVSYHIYNF